jgi:two-component system sensor histidine kinase AgrC
MVLFLSVIGALSYQFTGVYGALFILCFNFLLYYIDIKKIDTCFRRPRYCDDI